MNMARQPLSIYPIRTATVLLRVGELSVLTDPWFGRVMSGRKVLRLPAIEVAELPSIDVVLASHLHSDHFELGAVAELARINPELVVVGPQGTAAFCRRAPHVRVLEMAPWQELAIHDVAIFAAPAKHTGPLPREINFVFELGGWRCFFGGDALLSEHTHEIAQRCGQLDLAMLPVGGTEIWLRRTTMNPSDAVRACEALKPKFALGIHEGGEWPAMPPLSRHPGRRAEFDRLLTASSSPTQPIARAPGQWARLEKLAGEGAAGEGAFGEGAVAGTQLTLL